MVSLVSKESIEKQLERINFKINGWGRTEVNELHHIILPGEEIYECVNGIYEGGFALLLATDTRVLLVDKKILSFLTVEDLRFDMINEIDFSHRLIGAYITIATGNKTLVFRSYNKERLRKLIGHVQHCMAEMKKKQTSHAEGQNQHLEKINQQLQAYLMAQHTQQQKLQEQLEKLQKAGADASSIPKPDPVKPSPELADYLYANGLLREYQHQTGQVLQPSLDAVQAGRQPQTENQETATAVLDPPIQEEEQEHKENYSDLPWMSNDRMEDEIYADGLQEVFGGRDDRTRKTVAVSQTPSQPNSQPDPAPEQPQSSASNLDVNPLLRIAYSKLPQVLRSRKFGFGLGRAAFAKPKRTSGNQSQNQANNSNAEPLAQH